MKLKEIYENLTSLGYDCKIVENCVVVTKKNVARIKIGLGYSKDDYRAIVYRKSEFGGYKTSRDGPYEPNKWNRSGTRRLTSMKAVRQVVEHFLSLPEVTKTKNRPKDDRNTIFQNAIARAIQEKSGHGRIAYLAKGDEGDCYIKLRYVGVKIYPYGIKVLWETLCGERSKDISIQPSSPDFDPEKFIDAVVALNQKLIDIQNRAIASGGSLDKLRKVSGC